MIVFFVDPAWRRVGLQHIPLLYPFWGNVLTKRTPFQKEVFDSYPFDTSFYSITDDIEKADFVLMPYSHNTILRACPALVEECSRRAQQQGLWVLVDGVGDVEHPIFQSNVIVLRYGGYRFKKNPNEIHIPPYTDDLLVKYCDGKFSPREKIAGKPVVGFAGWTQVSLTQRIKEEIKFFPKRLYSWRDARYLAMQRGVVLRERVCSILLHSPLVSTHILSRAGYSGHVETASADVAVLRREFVDILLSSDYCLDIRGDANASQRLFEILSLGRIPVIVDTERNLPFSDKVEYPTFSLQIDLKDVGRIAEYIAEFHRSVSLEKYVSMQKKAREVYQQYFRTDNMIAHILSELQEKTHV